MRRPWLALAVMAVVTSTACSASPMPEAVDIESLFEANQERTLFRYEIRRYLMLESPICSPNIAKRHQPAFGKQRAAFDNYLNSLSDTQLIVDTTIAVEDGDFEVYQIASTVDCAIPPEYDDEDVERVLSGLAKQLERVKSAGAKAIEKLGLGEE